MNSEVFAEWMGRRGYHVIQTESSYWHNQGPRVYQAFPYHHLISPKEQEIDKLLRNHRIIGLRYSAADNLTIGMPSYHVVYSQPDYRIEDLAKKARYDVRKGMENAVIEQVTFEHLATKGWPARQDTLIRQNRQNAEHEEWWRELCLAAADLPGFEAWVAIVSNKIASSLISFRCDECCSILFQQSLTEYLDLRTNNALTYIFTKQMLAQTGVNQIFYGLHSLDAPDSVDSYKLRMNYMKKPVKQVVNFHPFLRPLINPASFTLVRYLARIRPQNSALTKAEGLLRFYLELPRDVES